MSTTDINNGRIDISKPRWDQRTYWGRARHFWVSSNVFTLLYTNKELEHAKDIVTRYMGGENIPNLSEDELWRQKQIYDSAFHPDTGEKILIIGRMAAQAPCNMIITGSMLTFYKSLKEVLLLQWINQSFNAIVNYCNRNGSDAVNTSQIALSYIAATTGACVTAISLNRLATRLPPIASRLVPFAAVAGANAVNLPLSRYNEIQNGMKVVDEKGKELGHSRVAAKIGIGQVVISRCFMAVPPMVTIPIIMNRLEKSGFLKRHPRFPLSFQVAACGVILTFVTPLCCAIFPQTASIPVTWLEPELQTKINSMANPPKLAYYNKGL